MAFLGPSFSSSGGVNVCGTSAPTPGDARPRPGAAGGRGRPPRISADRSAAPSPTPPAACCRASPSRVTNTDTSVAQTVVTDDEGRFQVLYLNPGTYSVTRSSRASRSSCRAGPSRRRRRGARRRRAGDRRRRGDGAGPADTPLLNTSSGISGTTIDAKQIAELPLGDGTAYMLTRLAPGIVDSSDLHFARPADNGNLAGIVANGVAGRQRVHHRRRAEHVERARRRLLAAVGRDRAVQGADQRVRRADGPHRRRGGEPRAEERHQRVPRRRRLLQPQRQPLVDAAADRARRRREADARVQPLHRHGAAARSSRTRRSSWRRSSTCATCSPSRPPTRCRPRRCAAATSASSRPGLRSRRRRPARRHAHGVCQQRDPGRPHQSRGRRLRGALSAAEPARHGRQLLHQPAAALRLQRRHGPRRSQLHLGRTACS